MNIDMLLMELFVTLIGIFIGTLSALAVERFTARQRKWKRATIILRSLAQELDANDETLLDVRPAYEKTPWGKSFYVSTVAWETALASGDLPDIIGFELADTIGAQYALLVRLRYYVNLMTQLWFAPLDIDGYERIRDGFRDNILATMTDAIDRYPKVMKAINATLDDDYEVKNV